MNKYFFFLVLLLAFACNRTESNKTSWGLNEKQVKPVLEKAKNYPNQTQLSIGIIENGAVYFWGIKKEGDSIVPVENCNMVFEIGSITKVFTATLLASAVLDEKLKLDDTIDPYLNVSLKDDVKITFKQLANHTSGLPRLPTNLSQPEGLENPYKDYDEEKLKTCLSEEMVLTDPGIYHYSNLGSGLLGYLLTQVDGQNFESLMQQKVFSTYGMSSSTTNHTKVSNVFIKGRDEQGNEVPSWDIGVLVGAGGVLSTVNDLSKFVLAHFDSTNTDLALTRKPTYTVNHISDVGLSWEIIKRRSGDIWYKHNGRTGGYSSALILDVNNKSGVIILSNISAYSSQSATINNLGFELMKAINTHE